MLSKPYDGHSYPQWFCETNGVGYFINQYVVVAFWLHLIFLSLGIETVGLVAAWFILTKADRQVMVALILVRHWIKA